MTVTVADEFTSGMLALEITGVASADNAGQGSIANPFGCTVNIVDAYLVTSVVASVGASNLSIGVTTVADAATDIINALDVNGVTVDRPYNCLAAVAAKTITVPAAWTSDKFLTFTADATMVDYVGTLYLQVIRTTVANA